MAAKYPTFPCACAFAKTVDDKDPMAFPRVGMTDNVLYRGAWIVRHSKTGNKAVIRDIQRPPLHAEAAECCFGWFDG